MLKSPIGRRVRAAALLAGSVVPLVVLAALLGRWPAGAGAGQTGGAQVAAPDAAGFIVDLRLPAPRFETRVINGTGCVVPRLPALSGQAAPPEGDLAYGWLVGVPEPGGAVVQVVETTAVALAAPGPLCSDVARPARPGPVVGLALGDVEGGGSVATPAAGPAPPTTRAPVASLDSVGALRGQSVARLVVRPLARADDGRPVFRSRLRLRIAYRQPASIQLGPTEAGAFAPVYGTLLNAGALPRRRGGGVGRPVDGSADARAPAQATWTVPNDPRALKLIVDRDGPVVVTGADLARAGWDLAAVDAAALSLSAGGRPVAYSLTGLADDRLAPTSRLLFLGRAMTGLYTRENVYWLVPEGPARRMAARAAAPLGGEPARAYSETLRFEQDTRWFASMNPRDGDDRWMWGDPLNAADPARRAMTVTLPVANLASTPASGRLRLRVQGFTDDPRVTPDHHVRVVLNGRDVGAWRFDGMGVHVAAFTVPPDLLGVGDNRLALHAVGDTGAVVDQLSLNRVELDTLAGYRSTPDRLEFAPPVGAGGAQEYALTGFGVADVTVWDIADTEQPVRLADTVVAAAADGTFSVRFGDPALPGRRYVAFTRAGARSPAHITPNAASDWRSGRAGADHIVVTHADFAAALAPLVERRRSQGLRSVVVDIQDVYDEFSFGVFDPRAIRAFLQHAVARWPAPAPTYVLLVGEANLDYRRGYGSGPPNYVPSVTLDEVHGSNELTAYMSDQWFGRIDDDPLPDLLVGRFSVSTPDQARAVVAKTLRYEDQPLDAMWRRRVVLVADDTDAGLMESFSEHLAGRVPADADVRRFYAGHYPITRSIAADIGAAVGEGALLLNFAGHANVALWSPWPGGGYIFDNAAIGRLANGDAMPIFMGATCMNGWVDHPLKPVSMAELWLTHPDGGGAIAWAPSGFSSLSAQYQLLPVIVDGLYDGRGRTIGALVGAAAATALGQGAGHADAVGMYVLLGDPALRVSGMPARPTPPPVPTATARPPDVYLPYGARRGP